MSKLVIPPYKPSKIYTHNLSEAAEIVRLIGEAVKNNKTSIALGIRNVVAHKIPDSRIIIEVKDCIEDNFSAMAKILGTGLTQRIKTF